MIYSWQCLSAWNFQFTNLVKSLRFLDDLHWQSLKTPLNTFWEVFQILSWQSRSRSWRVKVKYASFFHCMLYLRRLRLWLEVTPWLIWKVCKTYRTWSYQFAFLTTLFIKCRRCGDGRFSGGWGEAGVWDTRSCSVSDDCPTDQEELQQSRQQVHSQTGQGEP